MKKKLPLFLASAFILSQFTLAYYGFDDVNPGDWYYNDVTAMTEGGYLEGKTTTRFGAGDNLSNAEFCAMLSHTFYGETLAYYLETNKAEWYVPYLAAVYSRGGMSNTQAGMYYTSSGSWGTYVDQAITRYDLASMITSLLMEQGLSPLTDAQVDSALSELNDSIDEHYRRDVATAYFYQCVSGYPDGGFHGDNIVDRGQGATILAVLVRSTLISEENVKNYYNDSNNNNNNNGGTTEDDSSGGNSGSVDGLHPYVVEVFNLVNQERANYGLYAYTLDVTLCKLAQYKSDEMSALDYLDHTSPTYGAFSNILSMNGIIAARARENLARGHRTPAEVVTAWMNSTDHRTNLLATDVGKIGISFTEDGNYWAQLFTDSAANTEDGVSGDLGGSGNTGGNNSGSSTTDKRYAMEIPYFQYDNYLEVGYRPADYAIFVPVNNTGDFPLEFTNLYVYGAHSYAFEGFVSGSTIPVGGTSYVILEPIADLPVGQYTATVEFSVENLSSLFQTVTIYVSETYHDYEPPPDSEYVPTPDFEVPDLFPEVPEDAPLPENSYQFSIYGTGSDSISVSGTSQNEWYYDNYGQTKVEIQLSSPLPEGIEVDKVVVSHSGVSVSAVRMEQDRSKIYLTFSGLPYSYENVSVSLSFCEGYRVVTNPAPIANSLLINGIAVSAGDYSPYSLRVGDTVEMLIPAVNTEEYGFVVKNASGERVYADKNSSYGPRSSGIYTISDEDLYFSIGTQ